MAGASEPGAGTNPEIDLDDDLRRARRAVLSGFIRLTIDLDAAVHAGHDFSANSEVVALISLRTAGPLRARELSARTGMTRAGTTNMLDRLERAGLARRRPSTDDKRGVLAELTADGIAAVDAMVDRLADVFTDAAPRIVAWGPHFEEMGIDVGALRLPKGSRNDRLDYVRRIASLGADAAPLYLEAYGDVVANPHLVFLVLMLASEPGGTRPTTVGEVTSLSSASTSDLLRSVECRGLVRRSPGRGRDRRVTVVTATDAGQAALDTILDGSDGLMRAGAEFFFPT